MFMNKRERERWDYGGEEGLFSEGFYVVRFKDRKKEDIKNAEKDGIIDNL